MKYILWVESLYPSGLLVNIYINFMKKVKEICIVKVHIRCRTVYT